MTDDAAPAEGTGSAAERLADEIRTRRNHAGLSQARLAARIGYTPAYVSLAERPEKGGLPSAAVVQAIDNALGAEGALVGLREQAEADQQTLRGHVSAPGAGGTLGAPGPGRVAPAVPEPSGQWRLAVAGQQPGNPEDVDRKTFLRSMTGTAVGFGLDRAGQGAGRELMEAVAGVAAPPSSWAAVTYRAVINPVEQARRAITESDGAGQTQLRAQVDHAMRVSLSSDYGTLERSLPALIGRAEVATAVDAGAARMAQQTLSDVYAVASWTLIKADNPVGAWVAAQRAISAAGDADDALRIAAATRCLAEVHMRADNFEDATRTAFLAALHVETAPNSSSESTALSLRGAAVLSAAAAAARRGDAREAYAALKIADVCAGRLGRDCSELATVFGPTNVAIHRVAIAIELDDAREAMRHLPTVDLDRMPPELTERRARFLIDVARTYAGVHDDSAAIDALLGAERIAPEELRHHRLTREVISQLMRRESRSSDLRALAHRCGLLT